MSRKDDPTVASGITFGDSYVFYEGQRSQNRIRYDTPVWSGLQLAISNGDDGASGFAEKYALGLTYAYGSGSDPTQFRVAGGYTQIDNVGLVLANTVDTLSAISASALFAGGWNLTASWGSTGLTNKDGAASEQSNWMFKGGYIFSNKSAIAISYWSASKIGNSTGTTKQDGDGYGIYYQTECTDWWDVYAGIESFGLDSLGTTSYEDITNLTIGTNISF